MAVIKHGIWLQRLLAGKERISNCEHFLAYSEVG